jgi:catechol 2,3-dioxygenase-like lactoylglutathione lyase family enzyme
MTATLADRKTTTATPVDATKFHISLNVAKLEEAIAFYQIMLGVPPAKCYPDYAKFELADPPLVMSLEPREHAGGGALNHLGFRVATTEALVEIQHRLEAAGIKTDREEGVECCYARQTKFWVRDRDRNLWEIYVLEADTEHRGAGSDPSKFVSENATTASASVKPPVAEVAWEHQLGHPFPEAIPLKNGACDRVFLRGTLNSPLSNIDQSRILAEARRVLRPGGRLQFHGLSGDTNLIGEPKLPGLAAMVKFAPTHSQIVDMLWGAKFRAIRLTKLSTSPIFRHNGVGLREIMVEALKLDATAFDLRQTVVYQGPFSQVSDDFGNVFPRGQPTTIATPAVEAIRSGPMSESFIFFAPE